MLIKLSANVSGIALIFTIIFISVRCRSCREKVSSEFLIGREIRQWNGSCSQALSECPSSFRNNPPLVIMSLDGFRAEYLNRRLSPTLYRIAECGVKADFMYPVYPSRTFPNHYSLVTGLYPSSHGIIDNAMFDYERDKKYFKVGKTKLDDSRWWLKEPIWVTAKKQGKNTATFFWPGSDVNINGSYPNIYRNYEHNTPFETRVDQVLEWLTSPNRSDFVTIYIDEPDSAAHEFGPESQQVNDAIVRADRMVNRLLFGLEVRNLTNCVNIIIVSDHGMSELSCDRAIDIRRYIDISTLENSVIGTFGRLKPNETLTSVDDLVGKFQCKDNHMRAYRKEQLPIRMHYADNERIEPVIVDIDPGYYIVDENVTANSWSCSGGSHGYDNLFPSMRAIFFAHGPSFKQNITTTPFLNLELYELMCEVIGIHPQPNNGTKGSLHNILKNPRPLSPQTKAPSPPVAEVPANQQEAQSRVKASNCSCRSIHQPEISASLIENKTELHLPFGIPQTPEDNHSLVLLYNTDYILAYDKQYNYPRWTGFTITGMKNATEVVCWSGDARVENATCSLVTDGLLLRTLYPPEFSDLSTRKQAFYITNSIPKSVKHADLLEGEMNGVIEKKISEVGVLNVIIGPVFDPLEYGGRESLERARLNGSNLVPTHIFTILTWCTSKVDAIRDCNEEHLNVVSYVLPNFPYPDNCELAEAVIKKNVARIADIEKVTGITFFAELTPYHAVRLRTSMLHLSL